MALRAALLKSIWYAFTSLDTEDSGKVSKSQLKVRRRQVFVLVRYVCESQKLTLGTSTKLKVIDKVNNLLLYAVFTLIYTLNIITAYLCVLCVNCVFCTLCVKLKCYKHTPSVFTHHYISVLYLTVKWPGFKEVSLYGLCSYVSLYITQQECTVCPHVDI